MLPNTRVIAFIVSELLKEKQQGWGNYPSPPPPIQIKVNLRSSAIFFLASGDIYLPLAISLSCSFEAVSELLYGKIFDTFFDSISNFISNYLYQYLPPDF